MLSTTTSISTRSPTASSKKTLKVVVVRSCVDLKICKNLYKNNKIKKHPRVPKDHHISSLKALWGWRNFGGGLGSFLKLIHTRLLLPCTPIRAKIIIITPNVSEETEQSRRPSEQSHALRFAKTTSLPKQQPYKTPKTKTRRVRGLRTEMERRVRNLTYHSKFSWNPRNSTNPAGNLSKL